MIIISFDFLKNLRKRTSEDLLPYLQELKKIENFIHSGNFSLALENIEKSDEFSIPDDKIKSQFKLAGFLTLIYMRDYEKAEAGLNKLIKAYFVAETKDIRLLYLSKAYLGLVYVDKRDFESALPLIGECEGLFKKSKFVNKEAKMAGEAVLYSLKGKYFNGKGEFQKTIDNFEKAIEFFRILEYKYEIADYLKSLGIAYASKGDVDAGLDCSHESEIIFTELNDKTNLLKITNNIGMLYLNKGELDEGLINLEKAKVLSEELGNKNFSGVIQQNIGLVYMDKGELNQALEYFVQCKIIFEELGNKQYLADVLQNLGVINLNKGELDKSLKFYNDALATQTELGIKKREGELLNNIGRIYQVKADYDSALTYFLKGLSIFDEMDSKSDIAENCVNLTEVSLYKGDYENAQKYVTKLENLVGQKTNKKDTQRYNYSKALVLKSAERMIKFGQAQTIFQQISEEEIVSSEITIQSMLNLCEVLVTEIKFFAKEEIIDELKIVVSKLLDISKSQNMFPTLVESLILQSKLSLFELDPKNAQDLLQEAQITAEEKGLDTLAVLASIEYDLLLEKIESFDFSADSKLSFAERFGLNELEDLIQRMINKNVAILPKQLEEEPILLLVVTEAGIPIFSKKFATESQFDDMLISGFLTAINSFLKEAFATQGMIERIKQKEYTLLFQPMDPLTFCYVIKGPSYSALKKMDKFMTALKSSNMIWDEIIESSETGKSLEDLQSINDMATQYFRISK
ncbi:MAG: Photosystem I assembly protein Ycf3 [Candidatus Heimdallarchaeota archaeon LC_3]|nr:MAG: Photosystem I assembly protein Ycf3 [Candidatus Heimdallarchaeota archaeon LC_3]